MSSVAHMCSNHQTYLQRHIRTRNRQNIAATRMHTKINLCCPRLQYLHPTRKIVRSHHQPRVLFVVLGGQQITMALSHQVHTDQTQPPSAQAKPEYSLNATANLPTCNDHPKHDKSRTDTGRERLSNPLDAVPKPSKQMWRTLPG